MVVVRRMSFMNNHRYSSEKRYRKSRIALTSIKLFPATLSRAMAWDNNSQPNPYARSYPYAKHMVRSTQSIKKRHELRSSSQARLLASLTSTPSNYIAFLEQTMLAIFRFHIHYNEEHTGNYRQTSYSALFVLSMGS